MGNLYSTKHHKTTSKQTTDHMWQSYIKRQLQQNAYLYLHYEIYDEMTYKSGRTEIPKKKLLQLLKSVLSSLDLNFFISIQPTQKQVHYYINVSIVHLARPEEDEDVPEAIHIDPSHSHSLHQMSSYPMPTMQM